MELTNRSSAGERHVATVHSTARRINSYSKEELRRKVWHYEEKQVSCQRTSKRMKYELQCCQAMLR